MMDEHGCPSIPEPARALPYAEAHTALSAVEEMEREMANAAHKRKHAPRVPDGNDDDDDGSERASMRRPAAATKRLKRPAAELATMSLADYAKMQEDSFDGLVSRNTWMCRFYKHAERMAKGKGKSDIVAKREGRKFMKLGGETYAKLTKTKGTAKAASKPKK